MIIFMLLCRPHSFESVLVSGWSDNGWLSGGHAVRMAMELCKLSLGGTGLDG